MSKSCPENKALATQCSSCPPWNQICRNGFAVANGFRTSLTIRQEYLTSHGLHIKPSLQMKSGYIHSENSRIWAAVDSYGIHVASLHLENVKVCCFTPGQRIINPIFFEGTVGITEHLHIFPQLVEQLDDAALMVASSKMVLNTTHHETP